MFSLKVFFETKSVYAIKKRNKTEKISKKCPLVPLFGVCIMECIIITIYDGSEKRKHKNSFCCNYLFFIFLFVIILLIIMKLLYSRTNSVAQYKYILSSPLAWNNLHINYNITEQKFNQRTWHKLKIK